MHVGYTYPSSHKSVHCFSGGSPLLLLRHRPPRQLLVGLPPRRKHSPSSRVTINSPQDPSCIYTCNSVCALTHQVSYLQRRILTQGITRKIIQKNKLVESIMKIIVSDFASLSCLIWNNFNSAPSNFCRNRG